MIWNKVKISSFLKERPDRIKPDQANETGLKRLKKIDFSGKIHLDGNKPTRTGMILVKKGDLVISGINVEKGAVAVYQGEEDVLATIHYSSYEFDKEKIDMGYFKWFLKSETFRNAINTQIRGGIKTELKPKRFFPLEIHLPDLDTQIEIKNKLNAVNKEIIQVTNLQHKNEISLNRLREELLSDVLNSKTNYNNTDELESPKNFPLTNLKEVAEINPRNNIEDSLEVSFIPMTLISDGFRNKHGSEKRKWSEIKKGFTHFAEGDVVVAKITPCFQNRKSAVMKNLVNKFGAGTTELYVIRPNGGLLLSEFVLYLVKTKKFIEGGVSTYTGTAGQQRVKKSYLEGLVIDIPPLNEQKRIVEKIGQLMQFCDQLESQVKSNQKNSEALMNSVLAEAFEMKE